MDMREFLEFLPSSQTFMVCPYNKRTMELLEKGRITKEEDAELTQISDALEEEETNGADYLGLMVEYFGTILITDVKDNESSTASYLLVLVEI